MRRNASSALTFSNPRVELCAQMMQAQGTARKLLTDAMSCINILRTADGSSKAEAAPSMYALLLA
jgi:hypothetical protein